MLVLWVSVARPLRIDRNDTLLTAQFP
jgi:hypothetical protein